MTLRPYTGTTEGLGGGRRPGLEELVAALQYLTNGALWNNGTYGIRLMRDSSRPSVHGTGRAADLSGRPMGDHRRGCTRAQLHGYADWLVANADVLGIELVVDYGYTGPLGRGGRTWRCDRGTWRYPNVGDLSGGGQSWGDWLHVEVSPDMADADRPTVAYRLGTALGGVGKPPVPPRYPGREYKLGIRGSVVVERIQARLGIKVDGYFGPVTEAAVKAFQKANGLTVDGIVGPITWAALFR